MLQMQMSQFSEIGISIMWQFKSYSLYKICTVAGGIKKIVFDSSSEPAP
jgi:hypothetical protein